MIFWPNWKPAPRGPSVCAVVDCNKPRHEYDGKIRRWCEEHAKEWDERVKEIHWGPRTPHITITAEDIARARPPDNVVSFEEEKLMRELLASVEERLWPSK